MKLRKTKKAYKLQKMDYNANRYARYLLLLEHRRKQAINAAMSAAVALAGQLRIASIQASVGADRLTKSIMIANATIDTGNAISRIFGKTN